MKCTACDTDNKETAKFCRGCGGKLFQEGQQGSTPDTPMKPCPACQGMVKEEAKFCPKCGHNFGSAPADTTPLATPAIQPAIASSGMPKEAIASEAASSLDDWVSCPACGGQTKKNAKFCGKCGFSFVASPPPEPSEDVEPRIDVVPVTSDSVESPEEAAVHAEEAQEERETHSSGPEIVPQAAKNEDVARKRNSVNIAMLGAALVFAISGVGYWQFSAKKAAEPALQEAQAEAVPDVAVEPASSVSVAETKGENELPPQVTQAPSEVAESKLAHSEKKASQPSSVKAHAKEEPKPSAAPVIAAKPQPPLPPVQDVKLDSQSESMLAMGEQMYAGNMSAGALDAANQVLKKYPGHPRATKLKNKAQSKIDRQMASIQKSIK